MIRINLQRNCFKGGFKFSSFDIQHTWSFKLKPSLFWLLKFWFKPSSSIYMIMFWSNWLFGVEWVLFGLYEQNHNTTVVKYVVWYKQMLVVGTSMIGAVKCGCVSCFDTAAHWSTEGLLHLLDFSRRTIAAPRAGGAEGKSIMWKLPSSFVSLHSRRPCFLGEQNRSCVFFF